MRSTRYAWLSAGTLVLGLGLTTLLSAPLSASAAPPVRSAQVLDPTLQALATQAALAVTQAALIPTPNPTALTRSVNQAGAITIQGTLTISGAVDLSGPYSLQLLDTAGIRPDLVSCAAFAQGIRNTDGTGFGVPNSALGTSIGGHTVLMPVSVSPYPGPGDYHGDSGVQLGPGVIVDDTNYLIADAGIDYDVTVGADGSGSFSFGNLRAGSLTTGQETGAVISGFDVWTCSPQP